MTSKRPVLDLKEACNVANKQRRPGLDLNEAWI